MINVIEKNKNICKNRIREDLRSILSKAKYEAKKKSFHLFAKFAYFCDVINE